MRPTAVYFKLDMRAAFQQLERLPALAASQQAVPEVAQILRSWYSGGVKHLWRNAAGRFEEVESDRGFDQGCPLAPAAFAVALRACLDPFATEVCRLDPNGKLYAYLDDVYLVVEASLAGVALAALTRSLAPMGLELQRTKTKVWSPVGPSVVLPELQHLYSPVLEVLGRHLRTSGDTEDAPATVGAEGGLDQSTERLKKLWEALQSLKQAGLRRQSAAALFKTYAGSASQHALRMQLANDAETERYDSELKRCWERLAERSLDENGRALLGLPTKLGGVGAQYASTRRFAAYLASWGKAVEEVMEDLGSSAVAEGLARLPSIHARLQTAWEGLQGQGVRIAEGGSLNDALRRTLSQKLLVEKVRKTKYAALLQRLPLLHQADIRGAGGPGAGGFLCHPCEDMASMEDEYWAVAVRSRLRQEHAEHKEAEIATARQTCCHKSAGGAVCGHQLDPKGFHSMTCQCAGGVVRRHGQLTRVPGSLVQRWLFERPLYEQRVPTWDRPRRNRPDEIEQAILDMEHDDADGRRWLDISIRHPSAGNLSQLAAAARRDGEASRRGDREKHSRYPGDRLTPFVIEAGGRLGVEARQWLKQLVRQLPQDIQQSELARAYQVLSCTLQSHIARQMRSAAGCR